MATASPPPSRTPSCARSKLTALIKAPAPNPSTAPTRRAGHVRTSPIAAPSTNEDAASAPHASADVTCASCHPDDGPHGPDKRRILISTEGEPAPGSSPVAADPTSFDPSSILSKNLAA